MSEETQKSRVDSLIGVIRALMRIDPLVTLLAILIIAPIAIPLTQAILAGETEVVITFVIFIAGITLLVYIPLVIVKAYLQMQKDQTAERTTAIQTESKNRILAEQNKQSRLNELVAAQIAVLSTKQDFILGQSQIEDQKVFSETMEQLHEVLKNGGVNFVSQITFTETIQKILEELSVVFDELEKAKNSTVNNVVAIKQEHPAGEEERIIEDLRQRLDKVEHRKEEFNQELLVVKGKLYETQAHLAEVRDLIDQYRETYGELPEPTKDVWETGEPDVIPMQKSADDSIPSNLPEPFATDDFSDGTAKKDNIIISTVKKVIDKVTPDKSVLTDAMDVLEGLKDETDDEPRDFPPEPTTSSFREIQRGAEAPKLVPKFWTCQCGKNNNMKKVRCPGCGKSRAAQTVV
jgi:hypothetical protein